jgi:hypothetical protein
MYQAINAVSQMIGKHKMLIDTHKELTHDLTERIIILEIHLEENK